MQKLGLIAGGNKLPLQIVQHCKENNIDLYCVLIDGFAKKEDYKNEKFITIKIGQVGKAINFFKKNKVEKLLFAGNVKKPSFGLMRLDFKGFLLLKSILKNKILGDNTVLETVINFLKKYNLEVLEIDSVLTNVKFCKGNNTNIKCENSYIEDINIGKKILETLSDFDIGQSIVVQQKNVIGIEGVEGTKKLIERCSDLKYTKGSKPVLVKIKKTNQTRKIDLPTVGVDTIRQVHLAGFAGIAVDCENCLVVSMSEVVSLADELGVFVWGV